jgi:hypothetical protein
MDFPAANPKILQDIWRRQEGRIGKDGRIVASDERERWETQK